MDVLEKNPCPANCVSERIEATEKFIFVAVSIENLFTENGDIHPRILIDHCGVATSPEPDDRSKQSVVIGFGPLGA
jgi:hypothetical protein